MLAIRGIYCMCAFGYNSTYYVLGWFASNIAFFVSMALKAYAWAVYRCRVGVGGCTIPGWLVRLQSSCTLDVVRQGNKSISSFRFQITWTHSVVIQCKWKNDLVDWLCLHDELTWYGLGCKVLFLLITCNYWLPPNFTHIVAIHSDAWQEQMHGRSRCMAGARTVRALLSWQEQDAGCRSRMQDAGAGCRSRMKEQDAGQV